MKYLLLSALIITLSCKDGMAQKISKGKYKDVDSVLQYDNGNIVIYEGKRDTVYYPKTVNIKYAEVVQILNGDKIRKPKVNTKP